MYVDVMFLILFIIIVQFWVTEVLSVKVPSNPNNPNNMMVRHNSDYSACTHVHE